MTSYFHLIFTTLDLSIIDLSPSANVTALQLNDPDNTKIMNVKAEFNLKNMVVNKPLIGYLSVILINIIINYLQKVFSLYHKLLI